MADEQVAGRGRHGRQWLAAPGTALLLSILFCEAVHLPWRYTSLVSLALAEAIELVVPGVRPAIKWPNDLVLVDGRKLAGVLAESFSEADHLVVIVGAGLNVSASPTGLPGPATSLSAAAGRPVDRGELLHALVGRLDAWLARPVDAAQSAWQTRLWGRGQRLRLTDLGTDETVVVLGAEPNGALRVRLPDGSERWTTTGELLP